MPNTVLIAVAGAAQQAPVAHMCYHYIAHIRLTYLSQQQSRVFGPWDLIAWHDGLVCPHEVINRFHDSCVTRNG